MAEEASLTVSQLLIKNILSALRPPPPPPPLPVTNADVDARTVTQTLHNLDLGNLALTVSITATLGLLFSQESVEANSYVILGFTAACTAVWNGILFERVSLQLAGIGMILICFYVLVASSLPPSFSWPCAALAAFSLIPFLRLVIISLPLPS